MTLKNHIEKLDALRIQADGLIKKAKLIIKSGESTLAMRSLQMAKGWLGKAKGQLGSQTPYQVVTQATAIPPTAETHNEAIAIATDHLHNVNAIRKEIKEFTKQLEVFGETDLEHMDIDDTFKFYQDLVNSHHHLEEASMWYRHELGRIREEALQSQN